MKRVLVVVLCLGLAHGAGTPKTIRDIFIKRCNEFQAGKTPAGAYGSTWKKRDCSKVADDVIFGFKYKDRCGVTDNAYQKAIQTAMQPLLPNKLALWSGVYSHSKQLAQAMGLYTLESGTLLGRLGDGLVFCGKKTPPGIDYNSCPTWGECTGSGKDAVGVYWDSISKAFAPMARGVVTTILNGSGKNGKLPFRKFSVCASIEVPNLNPKQVTKVEVLLVHFPGQKVVEKCATGASIKRMRTQVERRGIAFSCVDDPKPIHDLLCKENPKSKGC